MKKARNIPADPFVEKVEATIRRHDLLPRGRTVAVAVSGGPDSVALLAALAELAPRWGRRLAVLHVNHGLRGRESGADARFVRRLAKRCGLPFFGARLELAQRGVGCQPARSGVGYKRAKSGVGCQPARSDRDKSSPHSSPSLAPKPLAPVSEDFLREKRYEALARLARQAGASSVALGHHRDDLAETVLMRLLRGAGPAGLGGFRAKTRRGGMTLIRPLYECSRAEILDFLRRRGLRWREDRTNRDPRWLRNRIRHQLLPRLERQYNPRLRELLADNARWFQEDEDFFAQSARRALGLKPRTKRPPRTLPLARLRALEPPVLARLFRLWIAAVTGRELPPGGRQIEELIELARRSPARGEVRGAGGVTFYVANRAVAWRPADAREEEALDTSGVPRRSRLPLLLRLPPDGVALPPEGRCEIRSTDGKTALRVELRRLNRHRQPRLFETARGRALAQTTAAGLSQYFDADRIAGTLVLRHRRAGDRFHPLGAAGARKLKEFLIDAKVPVALRPRLPLLCDAKEVLWAVGLRTAHAARLTERTENILRVRFR